MVVEVVVGVGAVVVEAVVVVVEAGLGVVVVVVGEVVGVVVGEAEAGGDNRWHCATNLS